MKLSWRYYELHTRCEEGNIRRKSDYKLKEENNKLYSKKIL
jgi:hypothetical protein